MVSSLPAMNALKTQTVHLKLFPTPRSFPERREVLRVLERFGEVAMFKSLKYEPGQNIPNSFFSLFTTEAAAQDLLNASPIRYRLIAETASADPSEILFPENSSEDASEAKAPQETMFELTASPSTFNHSSYIRDPYTNPLYGPYKPVSASKSYIASSLGNNVPKSIWAAGLKDWETVNMRKRNGDWDIEGQEGASTSDTNAAFAFSKRERARAEKRIPRVMKGLRQLEEERECFEADRKALDEAEELKNKKRNEPTNGDSTTAPIL